MIHHAKQITHHTYNTNNKYGADNNTPMYAKTLACVLRPKTQNTIPIIALIGLIKTRTLLPIQALSNNANNGSNPQINAAIPNTQPVLIGWVFGDRIGI
jgi:hypothetical protein